MFLEVLVGARGKVIGLEGGWTSDELKVLSAEVGGGAGRAFLTALEVECGEFARGRSVAPAAVAAGLGG